MPFRYCGNHFLTHATYITKRPAERKKSSQSGYRGGLRPIAARFERQRHTHRKDAVCVAITETYLTGLTSTVVRPRRGFKRGIANLQKSVIIVSADTPTTLNLRQINDRISRTPGLPMHVVQPCQARAATQTGLSVVVCCMCGRQEPLHPCNGSITFRPLFDRCSQTFRDPETHAARNRPQTYLTAMTSP